jgi:RimJ/RimL family protein N-acetyltransferase
MIPYSTLSNGHLKLRPFHFEDSSELYSAIRESMPDLKPWMSWAHNGYSQEEARDYIAISRARWGDGTMFAFAITDTSSGEFLGACSLSHIHPVYFYCNLGYWVRTSRRGRGIAGEAARLAASFAFEKIRLVRVEVVIALGNGASLKVAEKMGVHREGILRNRIIVRKDVHDAIMFSFVPQDFNLQVRL